jgi:hypothetical protein
MIGYASGNSLVLAGAIIIAGLLISLAIVEKNKKEQAEGGRCPSGKTPTTKEKRT